MSSIKPTIGRKVWFYSGIGNGGCVHDAAQPFDATVVFVHPDGRVNLMVTSHAGGIEFNVCVELRDPQECDRHNGSTDCFATWMPYQMGQAAKGVVLDTGKLGQTIRALGIEQPNVETVAAMFEARKIANKARTRGAEQLADATDAAVEQQLQALGKTAPRITPIDIEANILEEHYFTASEAVEAVQFNTARVIGSMDPPKPHPSLALFTICTLVLKNGFVVTGESACASPEKFNAEVGQRLARIKAIDKVWPLMDYELRSKLAAEAAQPVSAGLTD